jgi:hypothetical protein
VQEAEGGPGSVWTGAEREIIIIIIIIIIY